MISVVICTNRPGQVSNAVRSVLANAEPPFELVVVAQGGDWAAGDLEVFRGDARLRIVNDPGRGLSRARNVALSASTGSLVLFTDDDCFVAPDWVAAHERVFEERPDVALVFGAVEAPAAFKSSDGTVPTFDPVAARGSARSRGDIVLGMGANMAVRRSAVDRVGLFDEQLGAGASLASAEDLDFALRIVAAGLRVAGDERPRVVHEGGVRKVGSNDRELWRRDGVGIGAVTAKCLRSKNWQGASAVAGFVTELGREALTKLVARRPPFGLRMAATIFLGSLQGAYRGLRLPMHSTDKGVRFR